MTLDPFVAAQMAKVQSTVEEFDASAGRPTERTPGKTSRGGRDLRPLWLGISVFGAAVVFGFGFALWAAVLGGDRALLATWCFSVSCFAGPL